MVTIQAPPLPDIAAAVPAFSTNARQAFDTFLEGYSSRYRIPRQKRSNIVSWFVDTHRTPINQFEHSQHYHTMQTFQYDTDHDTLWALPCTGHSSERVVVVKEDIFRVIEQEHLLGKHIGQDITWEAVKNTYYGISQDEVIFVVKQCEICHRKAAN